MNSLPICPIVDCYSCGVTLDRKDLPIADRNQCEECLTDEAVSYAEFKAEENWGR